MRVSKNEEIAAEGGESIGARLRALRRQHGDLTQLQVAKGIRCAPRSYQNWEADETEPSRKHLEGLARFFRTTPDFIRYGTAQPPVGNAAELAGMNAKLDRILDLLSGLVSPEELREVLDPDRPASSPGGSRFPRSAPVADRHTARQ
jgi:transcriptional regulator with XRE-family HTH domain